MPLVPRNPSSEGSLDHYLREISRYPLISRDEEAELALRIRTGDDEALERLVRSNLRFVVSVAKRYRHQGVPLLDLINEGNVGLIRAARKFDETRGIKFISYAVWWIRQAILQALAEQGRIVRVPLNRAGTLQRIGRRAGVLRQELGRAPSAAELAADLGISQDEVERTLAIAQVYVSIDAPAGRDDDTRLLDHLPDVTSPGADEQAYRDAMQRTVGLALEGLKERESKVLRLYFGLDGQEAMTLEEIGGVLGVTRERVRQIKERALHRLRHASRARLLDVYGQHG